MKYKMSTGLSAMALVIISAPVALAQQSVALEEITVTAQRKVETLQKAALAVDVVTQQEMIRAGVDSSTALNNVSPSVYVTRGAGSNASYYIRGVGNQTVNGYTDPAIALNIDGVYQGRPQSISAAFMDLERVEVLKGPQGTLYGRNATAGAINLLPVKPVPGETSGYVRVGAGDYDAREFSGAFNTPISDNFAFRLAGSYIENDGYNDDSSDAQEDGAVRAQIAGDLSEKVSMRLAVDYSTSKGAGNNATFDGHYAFAPGTPAGGDNLNGYLFVPAPSNVSDPHTGFYGDAAQAYYTSLVTAPAFTFAAPMSPEPSLDNEFWGLMGEFNIELDFGELVIIPAYRESSTEEVFGALGFQAGLVEQDTEQTSLEVRLSSSIGATDWIFGAYYFDESVSGNNAFNQQSLQATQEIVASDTESNALFARTTWHATENMRLVGGLRYTEDKKTFVANSSVFVELCAFAPPSGQGCFGGPVIPAALTVSELAAAIPASDLPLGFPSIPFVPVPYGTAGNLLAFIPSSYDEAQKTEDVTYRVAFEYDLSDASLLYASYETGYRSGGFSIAFGRETYEPEYLDAFTLGSKNRFFDNRLQLNAELFYWKYKDQQVNHAGVDLVGSAGVFTENIGESTIKGLEVDFQFAATESTLLTGSIQHLDNEVKSFSYTTPRDTPLPPLTGCPYVPGTETVATGDVNVWIIDCSGRDGLQSPGLSFNFGIQHTFDMDSTSLVANIDTRYRGERELGVDYIPLQRADSNFSADASLTLIPDDDSWFVTAYIRNLTDEEVKTNNNYFHSVSDVVTSMYLPPRTFGLRIGYRF